MKKIIKLILLSFFTFCGSFVLSHLQEEPGDGKNSKPDAAKKMKSIKRKSRSKK